MIDIEYEVYTIVRNALKASYPTLAMASVFTAEPAEFPFVAFSMEDNYRNTKYDDSSLDENVANVMFEANIFVKGDTRKTEAKAYLSKIDEALSQYEFVRTRAIPLDDGNIFRYVVDYQAKVTKNNIIYGG